MGFFKKIGNAFVRFMYGRNGMDQLNLALIWIALGLNLISMVLVQKVPLAGNILSFAVFALWVWLLFRMLSRNVYKRQSENSKWLSLTWKFKSRWSGARARHADKDHKYFTCKSCRAICRVPVGKGKIEITCPKCGAKIRAKT